MSLVVQTESSRATLYCKATGNADTDTANLQAVIDAAGSHSEVQPRIDLEGTFVLNQTIDFDSRCSIYGGTITRIDESFCTTTEIISIEAGSFTVDVDSVPSHWGVNTRVVVRDTTLPTTNGIGPNSHDNLAHASGGSTTMRIDGIAGNTITIGNGSNKVMPIGAEIVQSIDMFKMTTEGEFKATIFDGNRANNNLEDWLSHWAVHTSGGGDRNVFIRCTFQESPCENVSLNVGSKMIDCRWYDNNGSCFHVSTSADNDSEGVEIIRPFGQDCCEKSQSLQHSESYCTFSIRVKHVTIKDGYFRNTTRATGTDVGACDVLGETSHIDDDSFITFENMTCKNFEHIWQFKSTDGSGDHTHQYRVQDCSFVSCGDIWTNTGDLATPTVEQYTGIEIRNNKFWGSRIHTKSTLRMQVIDNEFYLQGYAGALADTATTDSDADDAILYLYGDHFTVRNNKFFNHVDANGRPNRVELESGGAYCDTAIYLNSEGQGSELRVMKNTIVEGNEIHGMRIPIRVGSQSFFSASSDYFKHIRIANNLIVNTRGNDGSSDLNGTAYGMVVRPGCVVRDNEIILLGNCYTGIQATGANATYNDRQLFLINNIVRATEATTIEEINYGATGYDHAIIARGNMAARFDNHSAPATQNISGDVTLAYEPDLDDTWIFHQYPAPF